MVLAEEADSARACVGPDDIATALSAGYQKYLPKPLSAAALIRTAAEVALVPRPPIAEV